MVGKQAIVFSLVAAAILMASGTRVLAQDPAELSAAERIARLQRTIEREEKYLRMHEAELSDPLGEYEEAETRFRDLDDRLSQLQDQIGQLRDTGRMEEAKRLEPSLAVLFRTWQQARDRFNLLIDERKALQEKIAVLQTKVGQDRQVLQELVGSGAQVGPKPPTAVATSPTPVASEPTPAPATANQASALSAGSSAEPGGAAEQEVADAKADVQRKEAVANQARQRAQIVAERIGVLRKAISLEEKLLETTRTKAAQAEQTLASLRQQLEQVGGDPVMSRELQQQLDLNDRRLIRNKEEIQSATTRLRELNGELRVLLAEQDAVQQEAEARDREAKAAGARVAELQNPFTPANIFRWLLEHGPRLFLIITSMLSLQQIIRWSSGRIVRLMAGAGRGTQAERETRAETLVGVFRNATSLAILGGGILMVFDEVGIPIVPLMGGAAVLGLAVAFGAQNLIRDYFSGFMVLVEDQYAIGDVVKIGDVTGKVERITLRVTVLRDMEGILHFIPHGTIATVSNRTHGWSRAVFEIGVAYKEDADQVMAVLLELARELRRDPRFAPLILDEPEMLGVDRFDESAVVVKFFIKTKPLQQWPVKRELLRRIKRRFDNLGIEIPFPHRTVYHRHDQEPPAQGEREAA